MAERLDKLSNHTYLQYLPTQPVFVLMTVKFSHFIRIQHVMSQEVLLLGR